MHQKAITKKRFGLYSCYYSETTRVFDQNGDEQRREDRQYKSRTSKLNNGLILSHVLNENDVDGNPKDPSFYMLKSVGSSLPKEIESVTSLSRNPDGTMHLYDSRDGKVGEIENCPNNTEHGTHDLVIPAGYISAAHETKPQN